ncbi:MAG: hypothetical protein JXA21_15325 [Anaerolineae bacterium]|nr:hypothetical protein [Anaerolineae bacterium]
MNILKRITEYLFGSDTGEIKDPDGIYLYVQCDHCGGAVRVRADKLHDLQHDYESGGFILRKEIMDGKCFRLIYATLQFDAAYHIVGQTIEGGKLITWEEYHALTQPPTSDETS